MTQILMPDSNSWLIGPLVNFLKLLRNEFDLNLYDALEEFVEFYSNRCAYLGYEDMDSLYLYTSLQYDPKTRTATLDKIFFLSKKANFIKTWDYTMNIKTIKDKKMLKKYKEMVPEEFEIDFPGLQFFASFNDLDIFRAKEILLQFSYHRNFVKKSIVVENDADNYKTDSLKYAIITYDLRFLQDCNFFKSQRYVNFKKMLPPNLLIELPILLDMEIPTVPESLRKEQLIQMNAWKI